VPEPFPEPPLIPSTEQLVQRVITQLQAQYPNFVPTPASPQYQLFKALAAIGCEVIVSCFTAPEDLIRWVGEVVYRTPPGAAEYATATSTWEATDNLGHEIPVGTIILVTPEGGAPVAYEVTETVTIPAGETKTAAGAVKLQAVNPGTEGNIPGAVSRVEPNELLAWVKPKGITLHEQPSGGAEEESTQEYTQLIRELAKIVKPQPILPEDFANFVRLKSRGKIVRTLGIDLLQLAQPYPSEAEVEAGTPADEEASGVERCVTVICQTDSSLSVAEKAAALKNAYEELKKAREGSFKDFIGLPVTHPITVRVVGTWLDGYNEAAVEAGLETAVKALLNPERFGVPATGDSSAWSNKKTLFYQEVVDAVGSVLGFGHYTTLEVNGGTADIDLTGVAPLVETHTLSGVAAYNAGTEYEQGAIVQENNTAYESITAGKQKAHTPSTDAGVHWKPLGGIAITLTEAAE
jgi:hypothetical protein